MSKPKFSDGLPPSSNPSGRSGLPPTGSYNPVPFGSGNPRGNNYSTPSWNNNYNIPKPTSPNSPLGNVPKPTYPSSPNAPKGNPTNNNPNNTTPINPNKNSPYQNKPPGSNPNNSPITTPMLPTSPNSPLKPSDPSYTPFSKSLTNPNFSTALQSHAQNNVGNNPLSPYTPIYPRGTLGVLTYKVADETTYALNGAYPNFYHVWTGEYPSYLLNQQRICVQPSGFSHSGNGSYWMLNYTDGTSPTQMNRIYVNNANRNANGWNNYYQSPSYQIVKWIPLDPNVKPTNEPTRENLGANNTINPSPPPSDSPNPFTLSSSPVPSPMRSPSANSGVNPNPMLGTPTNANPSPTNAITPNISFNPIPEGFNMPSLNPLPQNPFSPGGYTYTPNPTNPLTRSPGGGGGGGGASIPSGSPTTKPNPIKPSNVPDEITDPINKTTISLKPKPKPDPSQQTTPTHDCDAPVDPCQKRLLNEIKKLKPDDDDDAEVKGKIETERCEDLKVGKADEDKKEFAYDGKGIDGIESLVLALSKQVEEIRRDLCLVKPELSLPDSWQIRKMTNETPQLVLSLKEWNANEKKWKPSTFSITIPWIKQPVNKDSIKTVFKAFTLTRGDRMGILTLKDNSKLVVNAKTEPECKRVIDFLIKQIDPSKLPTEKTPRIVKRSDKPKEITVRVSQIEYYPRGQMSDEGEKLKRDWFIRLRPSS